MCAGVVCGVGAGGGGGGGHGSNAYIIPINITGSLGIRHNA